MEWGSSGKIRQQLLVSFWTYFRKQISCFFISSSHAREILTSIKTFRGKRMQSNGFSKFSISGSHFCLRKVGLPGIKVKVNASLEIFLYALNTFCWHYLLGWHEKTNFDMFFYLNSLFTGCRGVQWTPRTFFLKVLFEDLNKKPSKHPCKLFVL